MVVKLSRGSNSSSFKTVSVDIGVIGVQGKATEIRKTAILTKKKERKKEKKKEKTPYQITFKKKVLR